MLKLNTILYDNYLRKKASKPLASALSAPEAELQNPAHKVKHTRTPTVLSF